MDACCLFKRRQINSPPLTEGGRWSNFVVVVFGAIFPIFGGTTHEHIISSSKEADFLHMHIYFP